MIWCWQAARGLVGGLALFGLLAQATLLAGATVPAALLPASLLAGCLLAVWRRGHTAPLAAPCIAAPRVARWPGAACALVLAATLAGLCVGVLATPERDWDGVVSWGLRARWLAHATTLDQPVFRDPHVFSHSLDYPLLQPLLLAACLRGVGEPWGRLLFPALWLLLVALVGGATRRAGQPTPVAWLAAVAVGTTPALVAPGGGAVDSGYAELLLLTVMAAAAVALALQDRPLLFAAAALLPWTKPEGAVYGAALLVATASAAPRAEHAAATLGLGLGMAIALPLHRVLAGGAPTLTTAGPAAALVAVALLAKAGITRAGLRPATVLAGTVLLGGLALAVAGWLLAPPDGARGVITNAYVAGLGRLAERLPRLPGILLGLLEHLGNPRRFGLLFPALLLAAALHRRLGLPPCPRPTLGLWLLMALPILLLPFLISPEPDLQHHLRSSMDRLLLHWTGAAWLLATLWCGGGAARAATRITAPA